MIHMMSQSPRAVNFELAGTMAETRLKTLTRTRRRVTRRAILPGTTSGATRKESQDRAT